MEKCRKQKSDAKSTFAPLIVQIISKSHTLMKQYKCRNFPTQKERILRAFRWKPKTMLQVAKLTGIERANICRLIANIEDKNLIEKTHFGICPISKHRAGFYLTIEKYEDD